jgi:hypothetical protein
MISRPEKRAVRPEIEARKLAGVTESLPNSKTSNASKRGDALKGRIHADSKAMERQEPCVVMKRADTIYPVELRSETEEYPRCYKRRFRT